jgi:iron complex transport system substrate-binding protein
MARRRNLVCLVSALVAVCACGRTDPGPDRATAPRRIVSLAPSLTETLFAIGAGDRVVGVTRYCAHPPAVRELPTVGGHLDPNIEVIVGLEPDLVVVIPASRETGQRLERLGISVLEVPQDSVAAILHSVSVLAELCEAGDRGVAIRGEIERRLARVRSMVRGVPRPRTIVVVGHQAGAGEFGAVWAAGRDTFYDQVVRIAGGDNAVDVGMVRFPELSREGLAVLDPEVVVEVMAAAESRQVDLEQLRRGWQRLNELRAVRSGRVHVLVGDQMVVPGPRLPLMVEAMAQALHPDLPWEAE